MSILVLRPFGTRERHSVIRRDNDKRVVQLPEFFQPGQHQPQLPVIMFDLEPVVQHVVTHRLVVGPESRNTIDLSGHPSAFGRSAAVFIAAVRLATAEPEEPRPRRILTRGEEVGKIRRIVRGEHLGCRRRQFPILPRFTRQLPSTAVLHAGIARSPALAGKGHVVPSLFERLGEDPGILGKMTDVITRLAQLPRVASREQRRTRRRRFRIRSVTILEQHTPCGHTVENRRRDPLAAISPEMKPCGIVGDAEQNIRTAHRIILPVNRDQSAQCGGSPKYKITSHRSHIVYCKIPGGPERRRGVTNLHWQYNGCRTGRLSRSSPKWHLPTVRY